MRIFVWGSSIAYARAMDDRRKHPRFTAVELKATWIGSEDVSLIARDVSAEGICLVSSRGAPTGSRIRVRLVLDFGQNRLSEPVEVEYRVVWCTKIEELFQIGAAAENLDEDAERRIATILHCLVRDVAQDGGGQLRFRTRH
jgi:hypothetical protein